MRIHSTYKDYYDSAIGYGIDPTIHYNRTEESCYPEEIKWRLPDYENLLGHRHFSVSLRYYQDSLHHTQMYVGFCGVLYPCVVLHQGVISLQNYRPKSDLREIEFCYDASRIAEVFDELEYKTNPVKIRARKLLQKRQAFLSSKIITNEPFIELGCPSFLLGFDLWATGNNGRDGAVWYRKNNHLGSVQFQRMIDPFTAFQDIATYISNVLVTPDKPDDIPDKYKVGQHGFDKWSFRKHPDQA